MSRPHTEAQPDRHFVTALARGMEVLACFRAGDRLLGNQEIAQRCKLPKSTVSRLTYTLTRLGYLIHVEELGKYRLGMATLALGSTMITNLDVREVASPLMQELADFARAEVALAARDRLSMVYLVHCRSKDLHNRALQTGTRLPLAITAIGRAWLAGCTSQEREAVLQTLQKRRPQAWPALAVELEQSLAQYRQDGVTTVLGGWQTGVHAMARPLRLGGGWPLLAVSCGGPDFVLSANYLARTIRPRLIELATRIETAMLRQPGGMALRKPSASQS
ncbi:MAG: IclR family transcriptional regulator [Pseudomonadota bacterium]|nr:IclR family transcriptional regulator [Pseudomonadota bacterium]